MKFNFSAGPGVMPREVLETVQAEMLNFADTDCSIMELSHRSKEFTTIIQHAQSQIRELMEIPLDYQILFMQGGATAQFSSVIYNLVGDLSEPVDYIVSGAWSEKAVAEAKRLGAQVNIVVNSKKTGHDGKTVERSIYNQERFRLDLNGHFQNRPNSFTIVTMKPFTAWNSLAILWTFWLQKELLSFVT